MNENLLRQSYDRHEFLRFIKWFLPDFFEEHATITPEHEIFEEIQILGKGLKSELTIIEIKTRKVKNNERVSITKEAFRIMFKRGITQAIICFYAGGKSWRMSLLTTSTVLKDGKIKREGSNPHRYSYYLGEKAKTRTPHKSLIEKGPVNSLDDLKSRFSIEVVNKEFYTEISNLFFKLVGGKVGKVSYPGIIEIQGLKKGSQEVKEFAVRLIGRIIFCWFLREKKSKNNKSLIPEEILSIEAVEKTTSNYYHDILEPLFFETLNKRHSTREERFETTPFRDVPYLNGGLFSQINGPSGDYYEYSKTTETGAYGVLTISNEWFKLFFELLSRYNFTVDENTSYDVDLSIDPEMLGRIFENLLAEINPSTGESARKKTGSYYTPREIVEYMVNQSISKYIVNKTQISEEVVNKVISYNANDDDEIALTDQEKSSIIDSLFSIKILDPACGSGAYPIGILQKIVYILQTIDPDAEYWLEKQLKSASLEFERDIREKYKEGSYDYLRKLGVIRESIFGIDIQSIAMEITRLRCFLTLIVDEPVDDNKENRGIKPLPNLDFKFISANSLLPLPGFDEPMSLFENKSHIDGLRKIRNQFFNAEVEEKKDLESKFKGLQLDMYQEVVQSYKSINNASKRYEALMSWRPFEHEMTNWFDPEWMFGESNFDIVIGNPPYGASVERDEEKIYKAYYESAQTKNGIKGSTDTFVIFLDRGHDLLKKGGILAYIVPMSLTSSDAMEALHNKLKRDCSEIYISSYAVRPKPVFQNAVVDTSIIIFSKDEKPNEHIYSTKLNRRTDNFNLQYLVDNLEFTDTTNFDIPGRIPKIGTSLECDILAKVLKQSPIANFKLPNGAPIYYRAAGGRYFKVITNYSTGSSAEKTLYVSEKMRNAIACILSSSLSFWFYQVISDNHNWKSSEIESFTIPTIDGKKIKLLEALYKKYLDDIQKNANVRIASGNSTYKISEFTEYKIVKSKKIIDQIDDLICPLYGLSKEETEFIKNYELDIRMNGDS